MPKSARLDIRISEDLKQRVEVEAERRGQKITTFVERALEQALSETGPSSLPVQPDILVVGASTSIKPPARRSATAPAFNRATTLKR